MITSAPPPGPIFRVQGGGGARRWVGGSSSSFVRKRNRLFIYQYINIISSVPPNRSPTTFPYTHPHRGKLCQAPSLQTRASLHHRHFLHTFLNDRLFQQWSRRREWIQFQVLHQILGNGILIEPSFGACVCVHFVSLSFTWRGIKEVIVSLENPVFFFSLVSFHHDDLPTDRV